MSLCLQWLIGEIPADKNFTFSQMGVSHWDMSFKTVESGMTRRSHMDVFMRF